MKKYFQIIVLLFSLNFFCQSKEQKIEYLIKESGSFDSMKSALFDYHLENLKNVGDKTDNRIKTLENKLTDKEILKRLSNAYSKTYSDKEIDEIYKFFVSEAGKKYQKSQNLVGDNVKDNFIDIFKEINQIQEGNQEKQTNQASHLIKFFETKFEKANGFYLVTENKLNIDESDLELEENPSFTPNDIQEIKASYDDLGNLVIDIKFKELSSKKLKQLTANNINKGMAIIIDKKIITMPIITSEIPDGKLQISGGFTVEEIENIVNKLKR